jgi:hypothetical protein
MLTPWGTSHSQPASPTHQLTTRHDRVWVQFECVSYDYLLDTKKLESCLNKRCWRSEAVEILLFVYPPCASEFDEVTCYVQGH